ncbi:MAG: hypothetical protein ABIX37_04605 [Gammaproteobacteria bacterium]
MPDMQEIIALAIVALVAGVWIWRKVSQRNSRTRATSKAGACGDCTSSGPPPKEATVRFYRKRNDGNASP